MTKIWNDIVALVEDKFVCDDRVRKYSGDEQLADAIEDLLEKSNCGQYSVEEETIFESPGYDTGVVFAAWVEANGDLQTITYQWESM